MTISFAPRFAACLKNVAATGWFTVGRAPMTMMHSASIDGVERRRDGARADAFHERRDGRGVAQPRAVIDVVGFEARAHELLEQVRLLVRAFRRAEARQRLAAALVEDFLQPFRGPRQRLFPSGFAEDIEAVGVRLGAVDIAFGASSRRINGFVSRSGDAT